MKCPCCGASDLINDTRDMSYICKGEVVIIPLVTGEFCAACGEVLMNREQGDCYSEMIGAVHKEKRPYENSSNEN